MKQKTEWVKVEGDPHNRNHWIGSNCKAEFWCYSDVRWVNFYGLEVYDRMGYITRSVGGKILGDIDETED